MTLNALHEANRRGWDALSASWQAKVGAEGVWQRCVDEPALVFSPQELHWLSEIAGNKVAVLGSGDNLAAFALAGLGKNVTSIDISQEQLNCAKQRSNELNLAIEFIRADVTDLSSLDSASFDLVYTGGHVAVWVSDLPKYYSEAARILASGGLFVVSEYHPFRRIFTQESSVYEIENAYLNRGPFQYDRAQSNAVDAILSGPLPSFEFHWTIGDIINAIIAGGCEIVDCQEFGSGVAAWEGLPSGDLPESLLVVSRKRN